MSSEREAAQAEAILNNPIWRAAWDRLELELWHEFQDVDPMHAEALKGIATRRWALAIIRAELERVMQLPDLEHSMQGL